MHSRQRLPLHSTVCLAALLVLGTIAGAKEKPARAEPAPSVEQLIARLGHHDFRVRETAQLALAERGPASLPALRQAHKVLKDPEVLRRLDRLIRQLETRVLLTPTLVTLNLTNRPIKDALDQLTKQTGYKFESWNTNTDNQMHSFKLERLPFWKVLDEVCKKGGLVLGSSYGSAALRLSYQDAYTPHVCHNGVFRLAATGFYYSRNNDISSIPRRGLASDNRSESLSFNFTISTEPRLPLLSVGLPEILEAYDNLKNPIETGKQGSSYYAGYYRSSSGSRSFMQQAQLSLNRPSRQSRSIKLLRGVIPVSLLAGEKPALVVDKVLAIKKKQTFKGGDTELDVENIAETKTAAGGKTYTLRMSLRHLVQNQNDGDYTWRDSLRTRLALVDAQGNKYALWSTSWTSYSATNVALTLRFHPPDNVKAGPPVKLIYTEWLTLQRQVKFEFKNLPLP